MNLQIRFKFLFLASLYACSSFSTQCGWWKFSEEHYHIPAIATGLLTLCSLNWVMGKSVDNHIAHEITEKTEELDKNTSLLNNASKIVEPNVNYTPQWEANLKTCYKNWDFSRKDNVLINLQEIEIPQEVMHPKISVGNPGIFGNISNFFSNEITIDNSHEYAELTQKIQTNITDYNKMWNERKKAISRYSAFFKLHTTFKNIYDRHTKSIAGFVNTSQFRQNISNYSMYTPTTNCPILDAEVALGMVNECDAKGAYPRFNTGDYFDQTTTQLSNALKSFKENPHINFNHVTENSVQNKINEGLDHLKNMNILFKDTIEYKNDLQIYQNERDALQKHADEQQRIQLERERVKTEQKKADAKIRLAKAKEKELRAKEEKERQEANKVNTENTKLILDILGTK